MGIPPPPRALAVVLAATCAASPALSDVPPAMQSCAACHADAVSSYLRHGMSRSLGPAGRVTPGVVANAASGTRYEIAPGPGGPVLTATFKDGGRRRQRIVGRIGAGIFDTSWVGAELDASGAPTARLFFAPVETLAGKGLALSPFELHAGSAGMDLALTGACLTCHTTDAVRGAPPAGGRPSPPHHLGADALERLAPLGCEACHGDARRHAAIRSGEVEAPPGELGLARLAKLAPGAQRDVCARCHLQGDARIDLAEGRASGDGPLAGRIPVLVPLKAIENDFRFVGQLERLALSACFRKSPAMTCTTCHRAHAGVGEQGRASFDAACRECHAGVEARHETKVSTTSCVECHVRRSAPFDLPHVRSADHFIRRRIAPPRLDVGHRAFADPEGPLDVYDDGRLAPALATPEGRRWRDGVLGIGLLPLLRVKEAAALFASFPPPGSEASRRPTAPAGLVPLETTPAFHVARGLALMATGAFADARAAFSDAIALDPLAAEARLSRARLALGLGDVRGALVDTQAVIEAYPASEEPWNLRVEIARRAGRPDLELSALDASTRRWPSNARAWAELARLLEQRGDAARAAEALARARALSPSAASRAR